MKCSGAKFRIVAILGAMSAALSMPALAVDLPNLADLKWVARPIVIFADSEADPSVARQLRFLDSAKAGLEERDVIVLVDTDPDGGSDLRKTLRPRGFSVILIGKDGQVKYRKPKPVQADEFMRLIDRMPMRRQELLDDGRSVRP